MLWSIVQLAARKREGKWEAGPLGEEDAACSQGHCGSLCRTSRRGTLSLMQLEVNSIHRPSGPGRVVCDLLKRTCVISHGESRMRGREGKQEAKIPVVALNPV